MRILTTHVCGLRFSKNGTKYISYFYSYIRYTRDPRHSSMRVFLGIRRYTSDRRIRQAAKHIACNVI